MKFHLILFFSLLISFSSIAKETPIIDSLKTRIKNLKADSSICYELDVLAKEYMEINPDSGIVYANKSLALARKLKIYRYQVDALVTLGIIYRERGEYNTSIDYLLKGVDIANKNKLGNYSFKRLYTTLNLTYTEQGNYTVGIEYGFKAMHLIEQEGDTLAMAMSNNNIANTYFSIKQYDKAMKHYTAALKYAIAIKHLYGQSLLTGNIGSVYYEMGKLDSAKIYFEKFLQLTKIVEDIPGEGIALTNLGSYYQKLNENKTAISYFEKAEKIFAEMKMQPNLGDSYYNLATSYLYSKDYIKSESYAKRALEIANKIESYPHKEQAHLALKNVYEKLNNTDKAYYHYKEYIAARDSIFNEKNKKEQFKAELVYEYDKKRYSDSLDQAMSSKIQQQELTIAKEKTEKQKTFTYIAAGISCLLLLLALYIFKNYKDKQKANKIISEQKNQVEIQKEEIELQKIILETKNKAVTDSIYYASRIQKSLLPTEKYIDKSIKRLKK